MLQIDNPTIFNTMKPNQSVTQLFTKATQAFRANQFQRSEDLCMDILNQVSDHADAYHILALLYSQKGNYIEATHYIHQAIILDENNSIFYNNLGEIQHRQLMLGDAIDSYKKALSITPNFAEAHYNFANVLKKQGNMEKAIEHYQQAIQLKPSYVQAYYNLGNTLIEQSQFKSAMTYFQKATELKPNFVEAHNNLGITLEEEGKNEEAISSYQRAISIRPNFVEGHRNLGLNLEKQGKINEARQVFQSVLAIEPENTLFKLHVETMCPSVFFSNEEIDQYRTKLLSTLDEYIDHPFSIELNQLPLSNASVPFNLIYHNRDDKLIKAKWAEVFKNKLPVIANKPNRGKPHIGFVITQSCGNTYKIINQLSGKQFQLTVVCDTSNEQSIRNTIINHSVQFLVFPYSRLDRAIDIMKEARFNILYYREIGTDTINYFLPFFRLAPTQCISWGTAVTTGIPQVDYYLSSELLETEESDAHYTETLIRLKGLPLFKYPQVPKTYRSRKDFGFQENQHIYFCNQNLLKVHPDFDIIVAEILRRDFHGVIVFIGTKYPYVSTLLHQRFQVTMSDVIERIKFFPLLPKSDYLSFIALADVCLDTLYYSGATCTNDAFVVGTPIVTLPGHFQRGRYTYAAYREMGILDCVADSIESYVDIAIKLGTDFAYRTEIKNKILNASSYLFEDVTIVSELAGFFEKKARN
jgi:predicted O-linked N-acetylglucosamine transferase (SPINDLY family)